MYCKYCGKEISETSKYCDSCGCPVDENAPISKQKSSGKYTEKKSKKKKRHPILGTIILIFGIALIIGAMGGTEEPKKIDTVSPVSTTASETQKSTFTVGDKVELSDIAVTLVDVAESNGANYMTPEDGKVFLICEFEIENNSNKDIAVSSLMSFEAYIDDYSTNLDLSALVSANKSQLDGTVAAGKKMNGIIGYSADKDWSSIEIRFTPDFWAGKDIIFTYSK